MKINVTWADIKNGKSGKPTECMVALALKRQLGVSYASVGYRDASVSIDGQFTRIYLPLESSKENPKLGRTPLRDSVQLRACLRGISLAAGDRIGFRQRSAPLSASVQDCLNRPGSVAQIGRRAGSSAAFSSCIRHGAMRQQGYRGECASEALAISCSTAAST